RVDSLTLGLVPASGGEVPLALLTAPASKQTGPQEPSKAARCLNLESLQVLAALRQKGTSVDCQPLGHVIKDVRASGVYGTVDGATRAVALRFDAETRTIASTPPFQEAVGSQWMATNDAALLRVPTL